MDDASPRRLDEESAVTSEGRGGRPDLRPSDLPDPNDLPELRIYSRSSIFFWWPVWLTGYILAAITYFWGELAFRIERNENSRPPQYGSRHYFHRGLKSHHDVYECETSRHLLGRRLARPSVRDRLIRLARLVGQYFPAYSPTHRLHEPRLLRHVLHAAPGHLGFKILFLRSPGVLAGEARPAYRRTHDRRRRAELRYKGNAVRAASQ